MKYVALTGVNGNFKLFRGAHLCNHSPPPPPPPPLSLPAPSSDVHNAYDWALSDILVCQLNPSKPTA